MQHCKLAFLVLIPAMMGWLAGAGCGKKAAEEAAGTDAAAAAPSAAVDPSALPGTQEVRAALEKKDYEAAIAGLLQAQQSVATQEQQAQYMNLVDEVKIRLIDEAPTDPKAGEALLALRRIIGGR